MENYSAMPVAKTEALTDNEIPDGNNSVVLKEIRTLQRQYAQVRVDPILPDILPDRTHHIWNQFGNTEVAQKGIKVIRPSKKVIHTISTLQQNRKTGAKTN